MTQKMILFFSGMPQSFLKSNPGRNTEIVSLSIEGGFYSYCRNSATSDASTLQQFDKPLIEKQFGGIFDLFDFGTN